jgi:hypothetical protein
VALRAFVDEPVVDCQLGEADLCALVGFRRQELAGGREAVRGDAPDAKRGDPSAGPAAIMLA